MDIRALREKMQLSREKFGHLVGVTGATVMRWEQGKSEPSPLALQKLKQIKESKHDS